MFTHSNYTNGELRLMFRYEAIRLVLMKMKIKFVPIYIKTCTELCFENKLPIAII